MTRSAIALTCIGLSVVLMALGQPLIGPLTTIRLGLVFLVASTFLLRPRMRRDVVAGYGLLLLIPGFLGLSGFANAVYGQAVIAAFSAMMLTMSSLLLALNMRMLNRDELASLSKFYCFSVMLLLLLIYMRMCLSIGGLAFGYAARVWIDEHVSSGLSRLMNAFSLLMLLSLWGVPAFLRRGFERYLIPLAILMFGLFATVTGSRQSLILMPIFIAMLVLHMKIGNAVKVIIPLVFVLFFGSAVEVNDALKEWLFQRFTVSSELSESDELRARLWTEAIRSAIDNPFSGLGPDVFVERFGHYPHNGVLGFAATVGLVPALVCFGLLGAVYGRLVLMHRSLNGRERIFFVVSGITVAVMSFLNDLLLDPIFYIFMSFAIGTSGKGMRSVARGVGGIEQNFVRA